MFERAVAYAVYQDELREMIHLLKYERMGSVAKLLGGFVADGEGAFDLIVECIDLGDGVVGEVGGEYLAAVGLEGEMDGVAAYVKEGEEVVGEGCGVLFGRP